MSGKGSEDTKVQMKMFRTSRLQTIEKVPQVQVIDEVAKVARSMRRQVPPDAEGSEAQGGAVQLQSLSHKQGGQSADNDPRFTMNSRERQPRR